MNPHDRQATVVSVSDRHIVLSLDGKTFEWPREAAPNVSAGDTMTVRLMTEAQAAADRHEQARVVLRELLGGGR
ncbi:MAG: hypothetical protein M3N59_00035 [bacterium]|nr:hypothetical protein [bacterium]